MSRRASSISVGLALICVQGGIKLSSYVKWPAPSLRMRAMGSVCALTPNRWIESFSFPENTSEIFLLPTQHLLGRKVYPAEFLFVIGNQGRRNDLCFRGQSRSMRWGHEALHAPDQRGYPPRLVAKCSSQYCVND